MLSPALPALSGEFHAPTNQLAWIFTLYLIADVVGIAVMSALADRYGRRAVYIACVLIFVLGSAVAVLAPAFWIFLAARALQAFGAGGIFPVATAAIGDVVAPARRGAALGMVAAMWGLAAIVGPLFGGIVTHFVSWRWIFIANFPLSIAIIALAVRYVPAAAPRARGPLDAAGLALLAAGLLAVMCGITQDLLASTATGIALLAAFAWRERRAAHPLVPPSLLGPVNLKVVYLLEILIGTLEGALFFIPAVLVRAQHLSAAAAGAVAAIGALVFVAVIPVSGRALDRIGARPVLMAGTVFAAAGLALFAYGFAVLWISVAAMVVAGFGFGALLGAPTRYVVTMETPPEKRATAVGLLSQFLIFGQVAGASLAGGIVKFAGSDLPGFRDAYLAFALVALCALAVAALLRRPARVSPAVLESA